MNRVSDIFAGAVLNPRGFYYQFPAPVCTSARAFSKQRTKEAKQEKEQILKRIEEKCNLVTKKKKKSDYNLVFHEWRLRRGCCGNKGLYRSMTSLTIKSLPWISPTSVP